MSKKGSCRRHGGVVETLSQNRFAGFTLAEVLLTLGIIGVVAVLTVPTVVKTWQNKAWKTGSELFEAKLDQALRIMNSSGTLAGYTSTEDFVNELGKNLKISKVCKNDKLNECFASTIWWGSGETPEEFSVSDIKTASDFGREDWNTNVVGLQLNNGSNALIAYNPACKQNKFSNQIAVNTCIAVIYDTSGFSKPNTSGKDIRAINVTLNKQPPEEEFVGGETFNQVKQIIVDILDVDGALVVPSATIMGDLGADSLNAVDIITAIEDQFDCHITEEDAQNLQTVQDIVDYIESH